MAEPSLSRQTRILYLAKPSFQNEGVFRNLELSPQTQLQQEEGAFRAAANEDNGNSELPGGREDLSTKCGDRRKEAASRFNSPEMCNNSKLGCTHKLQGADKADQSPVRNQHLDHRETSSPGRIQTAVQGAELSDVWDPSGVFKHSWPRAGP